MWFEKAVVYQIYPLGLCGAPEDNDGVQTPRVLRLLSWVDHIQKLADRVHQFSVNHDKFHRLYGLLYLIWKLFARKKQFFLTMGKICHYFGCSSRSMMR